MTSTMDIFCMFNFLLSITFINRILIANAIIKKKKRIVN